MTISFQNHSDNFFFRRNMAKVLVDTTTIYLTLPRNKNELISFESRNHTNKLQEIVINMNPEINENP